MRLKQLVLAGAIATGLGAMTPSQATTLLRASLDNLVANNHTIVMAEVQDVHSYWNKEGSFILTDVTVSVDEVMQGRAPVDSDLTFTVMGGTVDGLTNLILGGPNMDLGHSYLLFLNNEDLPGVQGALTIRELSQGIFDLVPSKDGLRAVSQASNQALYPDSRGNVEAVGGSDGFLVDDLKREIVEIARNQGKSALNPATN